MTWLHPFFLAGLTAASIPILLHLFGRKPLRIIDLPTIELLRRALEARRRRRRFKEWILVLLRAGFVVAVSLALARPLISKNGEVTTRSRQVRDVILLLDNSLSMSVRVGNESFLDRAKREALRLVEGLGIGDRAILLPLIDQESVTHGFTDDRKVLSEAIRSLPATRFSGAVIQRLESIPFTPDSATRNREIWILTDGTSRPWQERAPMNGISEIHLIDVSGGKGVKNRMIVNIHSENRWKESEPYAEIEVRVRSNDRQTDRAEVQLIREETNESIDRQFVDLSPGVEGMATFSYPYREAKNDLMAQIEADPLSEDNRMSIPLVRPIPYRVFLVNGRPSPEPHDDGITLFRSALAQPAGGEYHVEDLTLDRLDSLTPDSNALLVLADTANISESRVDRIQSFVAGGGSLLIGLGESYLETEGNRPMDRLFPAHIRVKRSAEGASPLTISPPAEPNSPYSFLANRWDAWLGHAFIRSFFLTEAVSPDHILLRLRDGTPLMIVSREKGTVALWLSTLGALWNDVPLAPGYPAFLRKSVAYLLQPNVALAKRETPFSADPTESSLERWNSKDLEESLKPVRLIWEKGSGNSSTMEVPQSLQVEERSDFLARLAAILLILESFFAGRVSLRSFRKKSIVAAAGCFAALMVNEVWALGEKSRIEIASIRIGSERSRYLHPLSYLLQKVGTMTNVDTVSELVEIPLSDARLSDHPFLYWPGDRAFSMPSESELDRLRRHLISGGFLFFDQATPGSFEKSVKTLVSTLFPGKELQPLSTDHSLYRSYFLIKKAYGRLGVGTPLGLDLGTRTAIVFFPSDLAGALEQDAAGRFISEVSSGEDSRTEALRFGVNVILYALTLDYKQDQIHLPFILNRRRS